MLRYSKGHGVIKDGDGSHKHGMKSLHHGMKNTSPKASDKSHRMFGGGGSTSRDTTRSGTAPTPKTLGGRCA